jgi:dGTP triphosphohydrolase
MFRRIKELNARMAELSATIQNATTDYEAAKQACKELTAEFEQQIERESQEELRKRKEMLAQVTGLSDPLATAAQALHDSATKPAEQPADPALAEPPKDEPKADAPAASKPRATGQARRAPAPAGKAKK